jgi:long-chain acyl-CoA synthetase
MPPTRNSRAPAVLATIQGHVEEVNRSLAGDEMLSGCQVHRFLMLHKELDADDGELTRTRKVRRRIIEEKFGDLIDGALRRVGQSHRDGSDL